MEKSGLLRFGSQVCLLLAGVFGIGGMWYAATLSWDRAANALWAMLLLTYAGGHLGSRRRKKQPPAA